MNTTSTTTARRLALVGLPLALAVVLTGCAGGPGSSDAGAGSTAGAGTGSSASSSAAATDTAADSTALSAAAATALDAVGSGTVTSIEQEQNATHWEVLVVTSDDAEHEVHTNADGTSVIGSPTVDDSDADDRAENRRFVDAAKLDVDAAAATFADVQSGTITELGLDDHLGKVVWEGDVRDAAGTKHSIRIDAGTGDVVTNAVDTDD